MNGGSYPFRRIGFIGRHHEEIPQNLEVILDSRTDHKIGHWTCSPFTCTSVPV